MGLGLRFYGCVVREIWCRSIILARRDEPTPDYCDTGLLRKDEPTPDYSRKDEPTPDYSCRITPVHSGPVRRERRGLPARAQAQPIPRRRNLGTGPMPDASSINPTRHCERFAVPRSCSRTTRRFARTSRFWKHRSNRTERGRSRYLIVALMRVGRGGSQEGSARPCTDGRLSDGRWGPAKAATTSGSAPR